MNLLVLKDDRPSQVALSAGVAGRTDRLCSEEMQYNATADLYALPMRIQASVDGLPLGLYQLLR